MKWRAFMEKTTDEHRFAQIFKKHLCASVWICGSLLPIGFKMTDYYSLGASK